MENLKNVDRLPDGVKEKFLPYAKELLKLHKENIAAIIVYGSSASGDYIPGTSGINSVVVFKSLGFSQLKESLRLVDKGIRRKIAAPLFLTPEHIKSSLDTFPLEFSEMKENHILIYGDDILGGLEIDPSHTRFICEEQLKGKLIRIRQAYLEIGLRRKGMEALVKESLDALFPTFRGLLRLKGLQPPVKKEEVLRLLGKTFEVDAEMFIAVLKDKTNDEKIGGEELESFLNRYIVQIEKLAELSDKGI